MPNPLTGDFDAVLQVSGATVDRLLASMHQNGFAKPHLPSFPHSVRLRIGDTQPLDDVRGTALVQVGTPQVELIHEATDHFILHVGIRARYRADAGSSSLPAFIHGTVRAEYRLHDIDRSCPGWEQFAGDYVWVRVVRDSVQFQGTAIDDQGQGPIQIGASAEAANAAKIGRQIAWLLATEFAATPQRVSRNFRRGSMRSLNTVFGGSAVAIPLSFNGGPAGPIESVENIFLENADMAVAVSTGYAMSLLQDTMTSIGNFTKTVPVHIPTPPLLPDIDTAYHVGVNPPPAPQWEPLGTHAVIKITVSGWAKTDSVLPNFTFDVRQNVLLSFTSTPPRLWLTPGSLNVDVHPGIPVATDLVKGAIASQITAFVKDACDDAQPALDAMLGKTTVLVQQLHSLDDEANAGISEALFLPDGILLRGWISVAPRHPVVSTFEKTPENDGYTAFRSWIPGGRVDQFEWSWTWSLGHRPPGGTTRLDRFVLQRASGLMSKWGVTAATAALPGIDGSGTVCLRTRGVHVDPVTGQLVAVGSTPQCTRFGFQLSDRIAGTAERNGRLFFREWPSVPELSERVPFPELALVRATAADIGSKTSNTLLLYLGDDVEQATLETLQEGLRACGRYDAGLALLVLFSEGVIARAGAHVTRPVYDAAREAGIGLFVNEDVHQAWSSRFDFSGTAPPVWRLVSPAGLVTWSHAGRLDSDRLTEALDTFLAPSKSAGVATLAGGIHVGALVGSSALDPGNFELAIPNCPPLPLGRLGISGTAVAFVHHAGTSSDDHLRALRDEHTRTHPKGPLVVIVDGATPTDAQRLKHRLGPTVVVLPDPNGTISDRLNVTTWPTTVRLDRSGRVVHVESGYSTPGITGSSTKD